MRIWCAVRGRAPSSGMAPNPEYPARISVVRTQVWRRGGGGMLINRQRIEVCQFVFIPQNESESE